MSRYPLSVQHFACSYLLGMPRRVEPTLFALQLGYLFICDRTCDVHLLSDS